MMSKLALVGAVAVLLVCSTIAMAAEVNVYSYRQPFLIKPLFDAFTEETGIQVNTIYAKQGLIERLKSEGVNSPADLLLTADVGLLTDAYAAGVTQAVESDVLNANIPEPYRDPNGHWYGLTSRVRVIVASKTRVKKGEISTYEALADPKWKGRICTRSAKHPYMVALTASMIVHHGEAKAKAWLSELKANLARKPQGNDRAQAKAVKEGQCDIALMNHYYMALMMRNKDQAAWADAVSLVFPNQEGRGAHLNVSGMTLTRSAPHRADAIRLMEFLASDRAQQIYAADNSEYPIKAGAPWPELLASWGAFKADKAPLDQVAAKRADAIKMADEVGYDAN